MLLRRLGGRGGGRSCSRENPAGSTVSPLRQVRKVKEGTKLTPGKEDITAVTSKTEPKHPLGESPVRETKKVSASDSSKEDASKSPKDKREAKKDKKHKNKSKTSLKDLQNILLAEAKRNIADLPGPAAEEGLQQSGDSDTPDTEERIAIEEKTGK